MPAAMFLDTYFSDIGRSTSLQLTAMRKQLGKGCDPCFDYASVKDEYRKSSEDTKEVEEAGGMDRLRVLLTEANAGGIDRSDAASSLDDTPARVSVTTLRQQREQSRPSSAFKNRSRNDLQKLDVENRFRAPPPGSYHSERAIDCLAAHGAVKHPKCRVPYFGDREKTQSRKPRETETTELQEGTLDYSSRDKKMIVWVDMARQIPRPDLLKNAGIVFNDVEAVDPEGVLYGHEKCAKFGKAFRQPCHDFGKTSSGPRAYGESLGEPGKYDPNLDAVKPRLGGGNLPFESRPSRKDLNHGVQRITDHLPDRSLARGCPSLTRFGKVLNPPIAVPDFDLQTDRPPLLSPAMTDGHDENDPYIDEQVMQQKLTFDAVKASEFSKPRPRSASDWNLSLSRLQEMRGLRSYGDDICLSLCKENLERGPTSLELLEEDIHDKPTLQTKVQTFDFDLVPGREDSPKRTENPARGKDLSHARHFHRDYGPGFGARSRGATTAKASRPASALSRSASATSRPISAASRPISAASRPVSTASRPMSAAASPASRPISAMTRPKSAAIR